MLYVRLAKVEDAKNMFPNLRPADLAEIKASRGVATPEVLSESVNDSTHCFAIIRGTRCIGLFGYAEETPTLARVWMLAAEEIEQVSTRFLRESRKWLDEMNRRYSTIYNFYHEDNTLHRRWLEWCGFTIGSRFNIGEHGEPFRIFHRNNNDV